MSVDANELLLSSGVRSASFTKIGDDIFGTIATRPDVQQQRDFTSGEPLTYNDGSPRLQIRIVLLTELRDPQDPDDGGERAVYIKGGMQKAVAAAVRASRASGLAVGGQLSIKYVSDGVPSQRGLNPPKVYSAHYQPPAEVPVGREEQSSSNQSFSQISPDGQWGWNGSQWVAIPPPPPAPSPLQQAARNPRTPQLSVPPPPSSNDDVIPF